ncbi:fibronectin type III-like domain-contianing protein, partial [Bacteroides caccae]
VMLYSSDLVASVTPDVIRLRHFDKIELQPGEMKKVVFKLKGSDLAFVGYDKKWRLEKGRFRMKCGSEVLYINCEKDKIWNTPNIN